ncbi:MAG: deoxynucleoside kinase [Porticoccaceae bacterium]|nr:deoxynucleoside kinase [Porticoccaceae bacterium]
MTSLSKKIQFFCPVNLDDDEYRLYRAVYQSVMVDLPKPDLVIYLQAPTEIL